MKRFDNFELARIGYYSDAHGDEYTDTMDTEGPEDCDVDDEGFRYSLWAVQGHLTDGGVETIGEHSQRQTAEYLCTVLNASIGR